MEALERLAAANPDWFKGLGGPIGVEHLGRGESYDVWRVTRATEQVAIRVPRRPASELPMSLEQELTMLRRLPKGIGGEAIALGKPSDEFPEGWIVTSVVPGEVLEEHEWTDALVVALAGQLAKLHVLGDTEGLADGGPMNPVDEAEGAWTWWRENAPVAADTLAELWPRVRAHQEAAAPAFDGVQRRLIHGDAALPNVLVDRKTPRLIDWEWAHLGDPARDLAYSGGPIHAAPWYMFMSDELIWLQIEAYAHASERLGVPVDRDALRIRRDAWLLHETFFTSAHFHRVGTPEYLAAAAQIHACIDRLLP